MRRRNMKTVSFAPPTFFEPSDHGGSSDEEDDGCACHDELPLMVAIVDRMELCSGLSRQYTLHWV